MISPEIFIMQADKICHEVFELFSDSLFSSIEIKQFSDTIELSDMNAFMLIVQRDSLIDELENAGELFSISQSFISDGNPSFFIIHYNNGERKLFEKYETFIKKLEEQLFDYFIKQYNIDNSYFYNSSSNSIIIQDSIDSLVTDISKKCRKNDDFSIYDNINLSLKNIINELSAQTYEKSITEGFIYFTQSPENANYQFEFTNYESYGKFELKNIKLLRKLMELTDTKKQIGIISDTNFIYGLGTIADETEFYCVRFDDDRKWTLSENQNELISIRNNNLIVIGSFISKKEFSQYTSKVFPHSTEEEVENMYSILKSLIKEKKGTILVIKKDAQDFTKKYQDLCIEINPVKLDEKNVEKLSSIDGAIIMDDKCICYGFGAVLDGLDTGTGNRARGSRYNSSERFYNLYKNEEGTDLMVFILSDDGNYNFFPPLSD